jgi:subtilisin family serine protease
MNTSKMRMQSTTHLKWAACYLAVVCTLLAGFPTASVGQGPDQSMVGQGISLTSLTRTSPERPGKRRSVSTAGANSAFRVYNVKFSTTAAREAVFSNQRVSRLKSCFVLTTIDRFADIFVEEAGGDAAWTALYNNPAVVRVEWTTTVTTPPPPPGAASALVSQGLPEKIVRGGYSGLTGKNVIVAIMDTGLDFRHPDFITNDEHGLPTSRIAYLWDTSTEYSAGLGSPAPFKYPNGASIGTLYKQEQLTQDLRAAAPKIPATDMQGHGTACAGIAAGNGNADRKQPGGARYLEKQVIGVAPDAKIIAVRLGKYGLENSYLINAIAEWLETAAGSTPVVVSGSFGGHYTGHDGQTIAELELDNRFPLEKQGRAIVLSAGNDGNNDIHAEVRFSGEAKQVSWNARGESILRIYFDSSDDVSVVPTSRTPITSQNTSADLNKITGQRQMTIWVGSGEGSIWLKGNAGHEIKADLYIDGGTFSAGNATRSGLVGSPGNMENAITVGSYDWNNNWLKRGSTEAVPLTSFCRDEKTESLGNVEIVTGHLSCYSSPGPTRTGKDKPDIVAPGQWYASADAKINGISACDGAGFNPCTQAPGWAETDATSFYRKMNGTSAATPYTAGIIALMFEKKPTLTLGEIKDLLIKHATKTGLSPEPDHIPDGRWGYGKLDMTAVEKIFKYLEQASK